MFWLIYPGEYIQYLVHFHSDRDYFECHEILEEYWKEKDKGNKHSIWVAFIQLAVSQYHYRRNNFIGAERMLSNSIKLFLKNKDKIKDLGIDEVELEKLLNENLSQIQRQQSYYSIAIPLIDEALVSQCQAICTEKGQRFDTISDLENSEIVERHRLRDRSDVIKTRDEAKKKKEEAR
ncbi:DUF309 domain-containing protein [Bacillus coahuilensis]|uniref:DUF309 domain-containing protein n=1 Tax=Bacillus coahuilensis TaxID=408580 RepID=UPI001F4D0E68|nr:DUF309 domain-containing protein [Bacillus coahuilensis]